MYIRKWPQKLEARISGREKGIPREEQFVFVHKKNNQRLLRTSVFYPTIKFIDEVFRQLRTSFWHWLYTTPMVNRNKIVGIVCKLAAGRSIS
jgi:hypothetical protein